MRFYLLDNRVVEIYTVFSFPFSCFFGEFRWARKMRDSNTTREKYHYAILLAKSKIQLYNEKYNRVILFYTKENSPTQVNKTVYILTTRLSKTILMKMGLNIEISKMGIIFFKIES